MRAFIHILFLVFVLASAGRLFAQDDYEKFLQKEQQDFNQFLEEEDRAFADFLKKDWEEFKSMNGIVRDEKPKPVRIPAAKKEDKPKAKPQKPLPKVEEIKTPPPKPKPKPKPKPLAAEKQDALIFNYYGVDVVLDYKPDFKLNISQPVNNNVISAAWTSMGSSKYKKAVDQLKSYRSKLQLNDWGYVLLANKLAVKVFPGSQIKQNLFTWFLLVKSGYNAKAAYQKDKVYLLFPSKHMIYGTQYVTLKNVKYYFFTPPGTKFKLSGMVYTYQGTYKSADKPISMGFEKVPRLDDRDVQRKLDFAFKGKKHNLHIAYNKGVVNYLANYPQVELNVYFEAPVSQGAAYSLISRLKPFVQNKDEVEAVNFLLRFVQTSFEYQTDQQQFKIEKYLMPEETLHYPYSDCEDRSILFAYLVRNLLNMDVVALNYPGHIATAVKFSGDVHGYQIVHNGNNYVVCDPTYINADAGMAMPQFKSVLPKVIQF